MCWELMRSKNHGWLIASRKFIVSIIRAKDTSYHDFRFGATEILGVKTQE